MCFAGVLLLGMLPAVMGSAQPVSNLTFVAFDIETTGLSREHARIVEIGAVKFRNGEIVDTRSWLVNPGMPIPEATQWVHGITDDMVADAPSFDEMFPEFAEFIGDAVLLAHNARFDVRIVHAEAVRNNREPPQNVVLDTLALARKCYPEAESYNLEKLMKHLDIPATRFHRGLDDAQYVKDLFVRMTADEDHPFEHWLDVGGLSFDAKPKKLAAR